MRRRKQRPEERLMTKTGDGGALLMSDNRMQNEEFEIAVSRVERRTDVVSNNEGSGIQTASWQENHFNQL